MRRLLPDMENRNSKCAILPVKDYLMEGTLEPWNNPSTIVRVESEREIKGKNTHKVRYNISDENELKAARFAALARDIGVLKISPIGIRMSHSRRTSER